MSDQTTSTINTLQVFKAVADNPATRRMLKGLAKHCDKCGSNRLDIALELYIGARRDACLQCKFAKRAITPIIKVAVKAFGVSDSKLKKKFQDPYWRRGLVNVIKGMAWFGVRRPYVPGAPFQVVWNITRACNMRCIHCYENAGMKMEDELSTEDILRGVDILADAGVLILAFSGGEPTVHPDMLKIIKYANDRGIYVAIATNGLVFSSLDKVREYKQAGLHFAQISLDGVNPETHDKFRGIPGAFHKTIQAIKNCVTENLFVEVATTVTQANCKEIPDLIDLTDKLGARWFMLYNFVPTGRGTEIIEMDLSPQQREAVLTLCWESLKAKRVDVLSTAPQFAKIAQEAELPGEEGSRIPTHFYNPKLAGQLQRLADFIGGCGCGRFYMAVEPNGDLYPCVFFPHEEAVKVGNLLKDDFTKLWRKSELLLKLRDKDILAENCGSCKFRYTCGGCRARAYNYFKNILAPDPGCTLNNEYWLELKNNLKQK